MMIESRANNKEEEEDDDDDNKRYEVDDEVYEEDEEDEDDEENHTAAPLAACDYISSSSSVDDHDNVSIHVEDDEEDPRYHQYNRQPLAVVGSATTTTATSCSSAATATTTATTTTTTKPKPKQHARFRLRSGLPKAIAILFSAVYESACGAAIVQYAVGATDAAACFACCCALTPVLLLASSPRAAAVLHLAVLVPLTSRQLLLFALRRSVLDLLMCGIAMLFGGAGAALLLLSVSANNNSSQTSSSNLNNYNNNNNNRGPPPASNHTPLGDTYIIMMGQTGSGMILAAHACLGVGLCLGCVQMMHMTLVCDSDTGHETMMTMKSRRRMRLSNTSSYVSTLLRRMVSTTIAVVICTLSVIATLVTPWYMMIARRIFQSTALPFVLLFIETVRQNNSPSKKRGRVPGAKVPSSSCSASPPISAAAAVPPPPPPPSLFRIDLHKNRPEHHQLLLLPLDCVFRQQQQQRRTLLDIMRPKGPTPPHFATSALKSI